MKTVESRARENSWYKLPIEDVKDKDSGQVIQRGLASECHLSVRQCKRCLEVAQRKGWIEKQVIGLKSGADRCWWRIVFQELARTTTLPLWSESPGPECPPSEDHVPAAPEPRARSGRTTCPNDGDQVPTRVEPRAHAGTHKAPTKRPGIVQESPPPPTPSQQDWRVVVDELHPKFSIAVELAKLYAERERTPEDLRRDAAEAIATAQLPENAKLWTKGPLSAAAVFLRNGRWPAEDVVSLAEHQAAAKRRAAAESDRQARDADDARRAAAEQARREERERRYGPIVDALDDAGLNELGPQLTDYERNSLRRNPHRPWGFTLRLLLINALARRDESGPRQREANSEQQTKGRR